jgi:ketopantoate reductase
MPCAVLQRTIRGICGEVAEAATLKGVDVSHEEMVEAVQEVVRMTARNQSSMLRDVLRAHRTEVRGQRARCTLRLMSVLRRV